jgi:programmed cell death 8 (apoptosis-inducing factor)
VKKVIEPITTINEKIPIPIPIQIEYVIVGTGTAGYHALQAIKSRYPNSQVIMIGNENEPPYTRPPLSKELWFNDDPNVGENLKFKNWEGKDQVIYYPIESDLIQVNNLDDITFNDSIKNNILLKGVKADKLDIENNKLYLENGNIIQYKKILLATGGSPNSLPFIENVSDKTKSKISTYRTIEDFKKLDKIARNGKHIVIIGGGFLGSETAIALANRAKKENLKVTQIFQEEGNMALVFPKYLTHWTMGRIRKEGVDVWNKCQLASIKLKNDDQLTLTMKDGRQVDADHVILAVGIKPNTELAQKSGLEIDEKLGGILVNAELEARSNVFAAGDNTSFHDVNLGRRRVEHYDHAVMSGRAAGENMTGAKKPYVHQSMFWSDLGPSIAYEAVGIIDSNLSTVGVWAKREEEKENEEFGKGVVFYTKDKKIVGILTWNILNKSKFSFNDYNLLMIIF